MKKITHIIDDNYGSQDIVKSIEELHKETENLLKTNFNLWHEEATSLVKSGELT